MLRFYSEIVDGFQSPRGVGVVQTLCGDDRAGSEHRVSITSRCRGGSDCKPTSRDLDFKKTSILFHFCHPFDYILAQFF